MLARPTRVTSDTFPRVRASAFCPQMGLHGAPLIYGLFMRARSAVIEFRPHQFEGAAPARSMPA